MGSRVCEGGLSGAGKQTKEESDGFHVVAFGQLGLNRGR
jgi:hypothetical protein